MSTTHLRSLFQSCDVVLENIQDGRIMVLANEKGCAAIERVYPEVPFDWLRKGLDSLSSSWRWICVIPPRVSRTNPPDMVSLSSVLLRADCRVVITEGESYKFLHDEADIEQMRPR
jgi:hypothetical protein